MIVASVRSVLYRIVIKCYEFMVMMIVASVRSVQYRIRSDKMLCIHGNSSKCEKCLRLKNNSIAKEKNNKKINDEMLCIHEMLLISSYYSTLKNH